MKTVLFDMSADNAANVTVVSALIILELNFYVANTEECSDINSEALQWSYNA